MTDSQEIRFNGIAVGDWEQAFRPGMPEYAATSFIYTPEGRDLIRVAFGNHGPVIDAHGNRSPRYTHAVTLPPDVALDLAQKIISLYGNPKGEN